MWHQSLFWCCGVSSHFVLGCIVTSRFVFVLRSYMNVGSYVVVLHHCLFMSCVVKSVVVLMLCFNISVLFLCCTVAELILNVWCWNIIVFYLCCSVTSTITVLIFMLYFTSLLVFHLCSFLCFDVLLFHCLCTWCTIIQLCVNAVLLHNCLILRLKC